MKHATKQIHPYHKGLRTEYTWSASFSLERPTTFDDIVLRKLGSMVMSFGDPEWPISGAVVGTGNRGDRTSLVLGLDPSRSFGTPDLERCETIAATISQQLDWHRQPANLMELRVILGRRAGYSGEACDMDSVRRLAATRGCADLMIREADLFSLRYIDGLREYHEPGIIVEGSAARLPQVLQLAADLEQERLVAEVAGQHTQVYYQQPETP